MLWLDKDDELNASTLGDQGKLEEVATMMKEVLDNKQRMLVEELHHTINARHNLAILLDRRRPKKRHYLEGILDRTRASFPHRNKRWPCCITTSLSYIEIRMRSSARQSVTRGGASSEMNTVRLREC
jgi:hypothetical protein